MLCYKHQIRSYHKIDHNREPKDWREDTRSIGLTYGRDVATKSDDFQSNNRLVPTFAAKGINNKKPIIVVAT